MTLSQRTKLSLATFAGSVLLCGGAAMAQMGASSPSTPNSAQQPGAQTNQPGMSPADQAAQMNSEPGQPSPMDKAFVDSALKGGMAEVQLGQLALQKSSNDDVKQFAQKMIDDHTKLGDQMKPVAEQIGVKLPDGPSKKDKAIMVRLQALNGDAFDKAYIRDMVKDHKSDLDEFKSEAANGSAPAVRDAANQGSKVIAEHLKMIEQIEQKNSAMASNAGMK